MKKKTISMASVRPAKRKADASVWHALRRAQRQCGCTTHTLKTVFKALKPFVPSRSESSFQTDSDLCANSHAVVLQLHGCVGCNTFVFTPDNKILVCPNCQHPRFNRAKKPNEVGFCFIGLSMFVMFFFCVCFYGFVNVCAGDVVLPVEGATVKTPSKRRLSVFTFARGAAEVKS